MFLEITPIINHLLCDSHCTNNGNYIATFYSQMVNKSNKQFPHFIGEEIQLEEFKELFQNHITGKFQSWYFYSVCLTPPPKMLCF